MLDSEFVLLPISNQLHRAWCGDVAQSDCLLCNNSVTRAEWTFMREREYKFGWAGCVWDFLGDFLRDFLGDFLRDFHTETSNLALRSSGNQNSGFQGVCVAAVTPFVV